MDDIEIPVQLSVRNIADRFGVTLTRVRSWIHDHGLESHRFGRLGRLYVWESDLNEFIRPKVVVVPQEEATE